MIKYISRVELHELLKDPLFVAYAPPGGKTMGGIFNSDPQVKYIVKKGSLNVTVV